MYTTGRNKPAGSLQKRLRVALGVIALSAFTVACSSNNNSSQDAEFDPAIVSAFESALQNNMDVYGVPGALAGVWVPGKGELTIANGVSDLDTNAPITVDHHLRVGSVTKSFTVTVILQLVDEGLLSLNDPLSRFFPDIQNGDATISDLANMRSGVFNYTEDGEFVSVLVDDLLRVWTEQELVDVADRNKPYFAAGKDWHYSNTSTIILGMIAEQITGNSIGVEIEDRILGPLGLDDTIYPSSPDIPAPYSRGYLWTGPEGGLWDVTWSSPSSSAASGAMISSLLDLREWAQVLGEGTLLAADTQQQRVDSLTPIIFDPCADTDPNRALRVCPEYDKYGLGLGEIDGWIGHTGEGLGYTVAVMFEPESKAVIVVLMNKSGVEDHVHVPTAVFKEYAEIINTIN